MDNEKGILYVGCRHLFPPLSTCGRRSPLFLRLYPLQQVNAPHWLTSFPCHDQSLASTLVRRYLFLACFLSVSLQILGQTWKYVRVCAACVTVVSLLLLPVGTNIISFLSKL